MIAGKQVSAELKWPRKLLRIWLEIFEFEPELGPKLGQTKPKIAGVVSTNRHTMIPNDSGPISACFDDDPKLLDCEIAQPRGTLRTGLYWVPENVKPTGAAEPTHMGHEPPEPHFPGLALYRWVWGAALGKPGMPHMGGSTAPVDLTSLRRYTRDPGILGTRVYPHPGHTQVP